MRILIAPDSFKGSLTSIEAAAAIASGIRSVMPDADIISMPLADGGEGTLAVMKAACGGDVRDDILYVDDGCAALIESADYIGLSLPVMQVDVFERSSAALGQAIVAALNAGVQDIRIGLGGSATVDGGLGLLSALGCQVLDSSYSPVSVDLNGVLQAAYIDIKGLDQRLESVSITLLCDVQSPLCGSDGAVRLYGPQKGIEGTRLSEVEAGMQCWVELCEQSFDGSTYIHSAAGAAGGISFALQLLDAKLVSGAKHIMQASGFYRVLNTMDWVVTGEGCSDAQSLQGKLPFMVAKAAREADVSVALISGDISQPQLLEHHFDRLLAVKPENVSVPEAMQKAEYYVRKAAQQWVHGFRDG